MSISRLVYRIHLAPGVLDDRITPPPGVLERVSEHDYLWEVENALLTYAAKRHNPTRHALAYCISSPAEQRVAVASMRQHPPKLISWQSVSGSNAIPNSLRFYVISQYIFQHYRPSSIPYYLEPASHDWKSELELPEAIQCQLPLNHLPLRWGRDRVEALNRRRMEERRIDSWTAVETAVESSAQSGSGWQASHLALPVEFNYLAMELQGGTARPGAPSHCEAALAFAPAGRWYDSRDGATFRLICDDVKRLYIVPVGCSPGWSWRREIEHIKITVPDGYQLERPETTCWRIDETRE
jgi:hypothetical protein